MNDEPIFIEDDSNSLRTGDLVRILSMEEIEQKYKPYLSTEDFDKSREFNGRLGDFISSMQTGCGEIGTVIDKIQNDAEVKLGILRFHLNIHERRSPYIWYNYMIEKIIPDDKEAEFSDTWASLLSQ